jgi:hypothetical protein
MTRKEILETAEKMVNGDRQDDYGTPEQNFERIAMLWTHYLGSDRLNTGITPVDVAAMLALLKIARVASGHGKSDNWIDLAGYAACGGELQSAMLGEDTATQEAVEDPVAAFEVDWEELRKNACQGIRSLSEVLKVVKKAEDCAE